MKKEAAQTSKGGSSLSAQNEQRRTRSGKPLDSGEPPILPRKRTQRDEEPSPDNDVAGKEESKALPQVVEMPHAVKVEAEPKEQPVVP